MVIKNLINRLKHIRRYWIEPIISVKGVKLSWQMYQKYLRDWRIYRNLSGSEHLSFDLSYPCLFDAIDNTPFDAHYLYQASWAAAKILKSDVGKHVDVGSDLRFVSQLSCHLPVTFVDIRPVSLDLERFTCVSGDLLSLPFASQSIVSLSCLHVAEHIGLGRYGDGLNPRGTHQACQELARVLAPGGYLYFSLPVGKPALYFNAHRVHAASQICAYFRELELVEFSMVDDQGNFYRELNITEADNAHYSCGLFWFRSGR